MAFTKNSNGLTNRIELCGQLVSLENIRKDTTSVDGTPYVSFRGKVRTGETSVSDISFRAFVKKKAVEPGKVSNYDKVNAWLDGVKTLVNVGEAQASWVTLVGSVTDEPYIKQDGTPSDYPTFNINLFNMQKEGNPIKHAWIDLSGSVYKMTDDTYGEDKTPTGNKKMELISKDFFGKTLDIKNIVIEPTMLADLEKLDCMEGATASFNIDITEIMSKRQPIPASKGVCTREAVSTEGFGRTIWKMSGFNSVYTDDESVHYLTKTIVKEMLAERAGRIEALKKEGYKGTNKVVSSVSSKAPVTALSEDEDLPY